MPFQKMKRVRIEGTDEQKAIWREVQHGENHVQVVARAGTGKTTTMIEGLNRCRSRIINKGVQVGITTFAKAGADELERKVPKRVWAGTLHRLGLRILRDNHPDVGIDRKKSFGIAKRVWDRFGSRPRKGELKATVRFADLLKQNGWLVSEVSEKRRTDLDELIARYGIVWRGNRRALFDLVQVIMLESQIEDATVDFADMLWLPYVLELQGWKFDWLVVDESQDLNRVQQHLALNNARRLIVVGDPSQSIYGFRGAEVDGMTKMAEYLSVGSPLTHLPLTTCWRCPNEVIALAQKLVPSIRARPDAEDGEIHFLSEGSAEAELQPGHMVLCRTNAPLFSLICRLWKLEVTSYGQGTDYAKTLLDLVDYLEDHGAGNMLELKACLGTWYQNQRRYLEDSKASKAALSALEDRYQCLRVMADASYTIGDLRKRLGKVGRDSIGSKDAVRLSTIHRAKGLEADHVTILSPELLPHPMAEHKEDLRQEENIAYVAVTRAKRSLTFAGELPKYFR